MTVEVIAHCRLEWDKARGVLYVHNCDTGATVLRLCQLKKGAYGQLADGQIDITGPFRYASYPGEI